MDISLVHPNMMQIPLRFVHTPLVTNARILKYSSNRISLANRPEHTIQNSVCIFQIFQHLFFFSQQSILVSFKKVLSPVQFEVERDISNHLIQ